MPVRVLVLGPDGSGKTAAVVRHLTKRFIGLYQSGHDILYKHSLLVQDAWIDVDTLDTSSFERRKFLGLGACIAWADCYLVVYDATHLNSAVRTRLFLESISRVCLDENSQPPIILIGTKSDLIHQAQVDRMEMERLASEFKCKHFLSSAASVDEAKVFDMVFLGLAAEGRVNGRGKSKIKVRAATNKRNGINSGKRPVTCTLFTDSDLQTLQSAISPDRSMD